MRVNEVIFNNFSNRRKNVCAYARVSMNDDGMLHSLNNQIQFYKEMILAHPEWNFVGVFHDKPTTGTKDERPEFQRMIEKCRNGEIDLVITKTISRFARNTVTTLSYTRELKSRGIDVFFESENLHTLSNEGELFLTLYAAIAQAESLSTSENCKWRIQKKFQEGQMTTCEILGYDFVDGTLVVNKPEAKIIRKIFDLYLQGNGHHLIAKTINAENFVTKNGIEFTPKAVRRILMNEKYVGDLYLQKWYSRDHISKHKTANNGERDAFYVMDHHEGIIDRETWERTQARFKSQREKYTPTRCDTVYPFTHKIKCGICGKYYRRRTTKTGHTQICGTFLTKGKSACPSRQIPETTLFAITTEVLGLDEFDEKIFDEKIEYITAFNGNKIVFAFKDGHEVERTWISRSRSESWTPEMRKKVSERRANSSNN